ncbi:MAG: ROK family protein [Woeseiaceae bacterium]|nr:ROK family protein [Woeseiaceae bacterium]
MAESLGIDIGGSGIKAAVVDCTTGELCSERLRVATPRPATPESVAGAVNELVSMFDYSGPVGCCFPTIVVGGRAKSASNMGHEWIDVAIDQAFSAVTGLPFTVINDADAAGMAEMKLGAGVGLQGTVVTLTIGTGIGSALFYDGQLIPNLELGHMAGKDGEPFEKWASDRARKTDELSWEAWGARFDGFLKRAARVCTPDHVILGGGASKKFDRFSGSITVPTPIHIARFLNNAGIVGAAMVTPGRTE